MNWRNKTVKTEGNEIWFDGNHTEDEFLATIVGFEPNRPALKLVELPTIQPNAE